jgi:hypothetical protein
MLTTMKIFNLIVIASAMGWNGVAHATGRTLYVDAAASGKGDGSAHHPFTTLRAVSEASRPGDTILVLPFATTLPALDGGIVLKANQRLIGGGASVIGRGSRSASPRVTNTETMAGAGDAIVLADNSEVRNMVVVGPVRGGIYGKDISSAIVRNNDLSGVNTSCTPGMLIYFPAESGWAPLKNGWAAVMIDASTRSSSVSIEGNVIHDGICSDGIDVRASGSARVRARINRNVITRLQQGPEVGSLLGIGLQTRDAAAIVADSRHNQETYLGNLFVTAPKVDWDASWPVDDLAGADCEGLFTNQTGGTLIWTIENNTFAHGIGGTSCNGAEFFVGSGSAVLDATVRASTFEDNPGDMIEENNLGTDSSMNVVFDRVLVRHTTHLHALPPEPSVPKKVFASFTSRSFCFSQFSAGPGATTRFRMANSHFADCAGDGIQAFYANLPGLPQGQGTMSSVDIVNSSIMGVGQYPLHWINYGTLKALHLKIENSKLDSSRDYPVLSLDQAEGAQVGSTMIDLGNGSLGSSGGNCFVGGPADQALSTTYPLIATGNWWGRVSASRDVNQDDVTVEPRLIAPPSTCRDLR